MSWKANYTAERAERVSGCALTADDEAYSRVRSLAVMNCVLPGISYVRPNRENIQSLVLGIDRCDQQMTPGADAWS